MRKKKSVQNKPKVIEIPVERSELSRWIATKRGVITAAILAQSPYVEAAILMTLVLSGKYF